MPTGGAFEPTPGWNTINRVFKNDLNEYLKAKYIYVKIKLNLHL